MAAALLAPAGGATAQGLAALQTGKPAPAFSARDVNGKPVRLSAHRGKTVVLEWTSPVCPFTTKKYAKGAMQALQREAREDGFVWIAVNTSGPGMPGHLTAAQAKARIAKEKMTVSAFVLDEDGKLGRLYGAKATPEIFIVDPKGVLVFEGGVDEDSYADEAPKALASARDAIEALHAHRPVPKADVRPYGCPVEYPAR